MLGMVWFCLLRRGEATFCVVKFCNEFEVDVKLKLVIQNHILTSLKKFNWSRIKTAKAIGISERGLRNFIAKMKAKGIDIPDNQERIAR